MANFRAFVDQPNGETLMFKTFDYDQGANKLPRCWDAGSRTWLRATRVVIRKAMPTLHECDSRCYNAHGRTMQCECSCGGKNHGKGRFNCTSMAETA
jgi:hypothetical protein